MTCLWKNKPVLCLGGSGFVGYHLVTKLVELGARVTVLDNLSRGVHRNIEGAAFHYGDVTDERTCRDHFKDKDVIFNLAATVAGVIYNQSHHLDMFTGNYAVQAMPLKVAAEYVVPKFVNVSSVCVYAPEYNSPAREPNGFLGLPTPANQGYSWAKRMGEMLALWYWKERGLNVIRVRPSNVFGPNDHFDDRAHVIPALIKKCWRDEVVEVNSFGTEVREFIYVADLVDGLLTAAEFGTGGKVYNLGTDGRTKTTIAGLLSDILAVMRLDKPVMFSSKYDPGDDARWSDCSKAKEELGWTSRVSLREGLEKTIEWYMASMAEPYLQTRGSSAGQGT